MSTNQYEFLQEDCAQSLGDDFGKLRALRDTRLLVTGGTGFVGSWITETIAFLNDRHHFGIHLTLLSSHASEFSSRAPHLAARHDVSLIEGDVRNLAEVPSDTDWIIHAAGSPDSRVHFSTPVRTIETIVLGTHAVLTAASRLSSLQRVLCLSSGLVCGPQQWDSAPLTESTYFGLDCNHLANLYVESKRAAEMITVACRSQFGLPVLTARLFTFVGPYQLLDRPWAINNFLSEALRGGPIRVQGSGDTVRSYMYGSDMAYWLLRLLVDGKIGGAYNVGSPTGTSLKNLAAKVAEHTSSRPIIELNTLPSGNIPSTRWLPDVSLAHADCGLGIRIELDQAIRRTIAWHSRY
jgi:dTDP-glucose 4,6-dehydratase